MQGSMRSQEWSGRCKVQGLYGTMHAWHEAQGLTWGGLRCKRWQGRGEGGLFTGG